MQWLYLYFEAKGGEDAIVKLQEYGAQGWELVAVYPVAGGIWEYVMKMPKRI